MSSRLFGYNSGATVSGAIQSGDLAVSNDFNAGGSVQWWNGPNEDIGYVIGYPDTSGLRKANGNLIVGNSVGFRRTSAKTDDEFLSLANSLTNQGFLTASVATNWLNTNGYYTSYPSVSTTGLVLNLDAGNPLSYPGSGTTWTNLVDNNTYTISNGSFDSGNEGSIVFNGTSTIVTIGQPLSSGTNYTMEAWVTADVVTGARNILSSSSNVFWNNGSTLSGGVGGAFSLVTSSSFPTNTWRHLTLTFNDTTNTMRLYINGTQVSQNLSVTQGYVSETLRIGSHFGVNPISFWDGKIAQVRVYNTDLSAAGVLNNYNATKSRYDL
jgi:hypothetical protein